MDQLRLDVGRLRLDTYQSGHACACGHEGTGEAEAEASCPCSEAVGHVGGLVSAIARSPARTLEAPARGASVDLLAWGTWIRVVVTDAAAMKTAEAMTRHWLDRVDRACSRFRPDSALEGLNRAFGCEVSVDPLLAEGLAIALEAAAVSGGLVTPTVGAAVANAGYDRTFSLLAGSSPSEVPRAVCTSQVSAARVTAWDAVRVDRENSTVWMPRGCRLDLGSTTKAWAADQLAQQIFDSLGCGVLVDLGGDLALSGPAPDGGWIVQVVDGSHESGSGPLVVLADGGLATSSTIVRRWMVGDQACHHIIDPRTGLPADDVWRTVSVTAARCVDANVASTAAVVLGEQGPLWLTALGLPARLVRRDGVVVTLNGWPDDEPTRFSEDRAQLAEVASP